jgi:hypothetical protein
MSLLDGLTARVIRASTIVDSGFRLLDRVRSALVVRFASNGALDAYNDLAYGTSTHFTPGGRGFRPQLFAWEQHVVEQHFPPAPARILIGGAGGGREALALAARGYDVVAFEPSIPLASSMAAAAQGLPVRTLVGRYESLPALQTLDGESSVELLALGPFAAAVFGMGSYSHLRDAEARVAALHQMGRLADGPVLLSFSVHAHLSDVPPTRLRRIGRALGFRQTGDAFSPDLGFYHWTTRDEIEAEVTAAGLTILAGSYRGDEGQWPWIVARREGPHADR